MFPITEQNMQLPLGKNLAERLKCFCFSITVVKRGNRLRAVTPFSFVFRRDVNETPGGRPYKEDRGARRKFGKEPSRGTTRDHVIQINGKTEMEWGQDCRGSFCLLLETFITSPYSHATGNF